MIENFILTITNMGCIFPAMNYYNSGQYLQAICIILAGLASSLYHTFECKKHNMPGIGFYNTMFHHHLFINLDRFFAIASMYMCYNDSVYDNKLLIVVGLFSMFTSEVLSRFVKPGNNNNHFFGCFKFSEKNVHVVSHALWHIAAFEVARRMSL